MHVVCQFASLVHNSPLLLTIPPSSINYLTLPPFHTPPTSLSSHLPLSLTRHLPLSPSPPLPLSHFPGPTFPYHPHITSLPNSLSSPSLTLPYHFPPPSLSSFLFPLVPSLTSALNYLLSFIPLSPSSQLSYPTHLPLLTFLSQLPHPTSLIPPPSSHLSHPTSLIPPLSSYLPHPTSLIPPPLIPPASLIPPPSSHFPHPASLIPPPSSHFPHPTSLIPPPLIPPPLIPPPLIPPPSP